MLNGMPFFSWNKRGLTGVCDVRLQEVGKHHGVGGGATQSDDASNVTPNQMEKHVKILRGSCQVYL